MSDNLNLPEDDLGMLNIDVTKAGPRLRGISPILQATEEVRQRIDILSSWVLDDRSLKSEFLLNARLTIFFLYCGQILARGARINDTGTSWTTIMPSIKLRHDKDKGAASYSVNLSIPVFRDLDVGYVNFIESLESQLEMLYSLKIISRPVCFAQDKVFEPMHSSLSNIPAGSNGPLLPSRWVNRFGILKTSAFLIRHEILELVVHMDTIGERYGIYPDLSICSRNPHGFQEAFLSFRLGPNGPSRKHVEFAKDMDDVFSLLKIPSSSEMRTNRINRT